ncbi:MAG: amidase [Pseudomonadales bacterium]
MSDLAFASAADIARRIRAREISSRAVTDHLIDRIERRDGAINAVVVRDFGRARAAADAADAALARGDALGALHGVPLTVKESYDVTGLPTTWGLATFQDNLASADSAVVASLRAAGAVILGKTNVPVELADFQSFNPIYGTTNNPWNVARVPGGSSGGSAAALAAGFTPLEFGSDIGGSIRNPAHFCGVYGHKPTWNIVPTQGHGLPGMLASPDIAVMGPLARTAEDLALALDLVAGPGPLATGWRLDLPRPAHKRRADYRVAIWADDPRSPVAREVADRVQLIADVLARAGAKVSDTARPAINPDQSFETYLYMLNGVMAAGLPDDVFQQLSAGAATLDPADRSVEAINLRSTVQHHRDWIRHNNAREALRMAWRAFFGEWDILICPQMPTTAFPHDQRVPMTARTIRIDNADHPYFQQIYWAGLTTVSYLPSTVFPTGPSREGLPIGLQAVTAEFADHTSIDFARLLANEIGGFVPPPAFRD